MYVFNVYAIPLTIKYGQDNDRREQEKNDSPIIVHLSFLILSFSLIFFLPSF